MRIGQLANPTFYNGSTGECTYRGRHLLKPVKGYVLIPIDIYIYLPTKYVIMNKKQDSMSATNVDQGRAR